ncbi:MAG: hypothetical protein OXF32_07760 [Anaerolineaceae bacterium]|nr:hypothetical protein [Anaerolineaceae bacterium]
MKTFRSIRPGLFWPTVIFGGILLLAAFLRLSHVEIAHFQLDQARIAQYAWELAREGVFRTHFFALTGGYDNFPLSIYLYAPPFLLFSHVHALLLWNVGLNLAALALCWQFARRYWGWPAAAIATTLLATAPWDVFYASRIWSNTQMPVLVMIWAWGTALAFHERRRRWWSLSWAAAAWLFQLHPAAAIFLITCGLLSVASIRAGVFSWRAAALGLTLGLAPALPWLAAFLEGTTAIDQERLPLLSEGKRELFYNWRPLVDFLAAANLERWFRGDGVEALRAQFAPLDTLAPVVMTVYAHAALWVSWKALRAPQRAPWRVLAPWLFLPLAFPVVSYASYAIIYYLPLLPAPFLALAAGWSALRLRWRRLVAVALLVYCALNANAVLQSAQFVRAGVARDDAEIWAVGGGAPLSTQLAIATAAQEAIEGGVAAELIVALRPVYGLEYEQLAHAIPFLARDAPTRILNTDEPHLVYPAQPALLLLDARQTTLPPGYGEAVEWARDTRYRLHTLPGGAAPAPQYPLPGQPGFANELRLTGHDAPDCGAGRIRLHWIPGPAADTPFHFFNHLLDAEGNLLAQRDIPAWDSSQWRAGDVVLSTVDFGLSLHDVPVETWRVGMYEYPSLAPVNALDAGGRPWQYAINIPLSGLCAG